MRIALFRVDFLPRRGNKRMTEDVYGRRTSNFTVFRIPKTPLKKHRSSNHLEIPSLAIAKFIRNFSKLNSDHIDKTRFLRCRREEILCSTKRRRCSTQQRKHFHLLVKRATKEKDYCTQQRSFTFPSLLSITLALGVGLRECVDDA